MESKLLMSPLRDGEMIRDYLGGSTVSTRILKKWKRSRRRGQSGIIDVRTECAVTGSGVEAVAMSQAMMFILFVYVTVFWYLDFLHICV